MPRGSKETYTDKQKRQAEHIEAGYEQRGLDRDEAARRAWSTVNKMTGGGKKSGSGRGRRVNMAPARKGGRKGGAAAASRPAAARSASAKKAARTRALRRSALSKGPGRTTARRGVRRSSPRSGRASASSRRSSPRSRASSRR